MMKLYTSKVNFVLVMILLIVAYSSRVYAELRVDITRGVVKPIPVAITNLMGKTPKEKRFNRNYDVSLLAVSRSGVPHQSRLREFMIKTIID